MAHGPQPRDYRLKLNKKVKALAIRVALSDKARHGKLVVVSDFAGVNAYSTKAVLGALKALNAPKALLSDVRDDDFLYRSARNIHGAEAKSPLDFNAMDLLRYETLVISDRTVARHLTNIFHKIGVSSRTQAARYALGHGVTASR